MKNVFVDTNILVYTLDARNLRKQSIAKELIERHANGVTISIQVLQEFYYSAVRKVGAPPAEARYLVEVYSRRRVFQPSPSDVLNAIDTSERYRISFWDSMIVEAAVATGCSEILTEDMNPNQVIRGVRVKNPFEND